MAQIRPFRALCPKAEYVSRVAALPYDVYHREEAAQAAAKDRLSFLNIDRPETQFPPDTDMYAEKVYRKADEMLQEQWKQGIWEQEETGCYYLYELTWQGRTQTGLVACASIDDYLDGTIKKHENTRADKEEDRISHVDACSMQTGPIFLAYRSRPEIRELIERIRTQREPFFDFCREDGIRHRGWKISGEDEIRKLTGLFDGLSSLYIADGHHRAASAVKVGQMRRKAHPDYTGEEEFNFFLSVLFADDELQILDYNRVVRDLNGMTQEEFLKKAEEIFELRVLSGAEQPEKKGCFTMCLQGKWYHLKIKKQYENADPVNGLDVAILQNSFLEPVLGIGDPRTDQRIDFVGGIRGIMELQKRTEQDCAAAFAVYPVSISELFAVADAGRLMPPKSTWFEPKLRSGLFLHRIER